MTSNLYGKLSAISKLLSTVLRRKCQKITGTLENIYKNIL